MIDENTAIRFLRKSYTKTMSVKKFTINIKKIKYEKHYNPTIACKL